MPVLIPRGPGLDTDEGLRAIADRLERYAADHPGASIEAYRHGRYVVRIRVIDDRFRGLTKSERHRKVWPYLHDLPEDVLSDVSTLLLLTPDEKAGSLASTEFDDPIPPRL